MLLVNFIKIHREVLIDPEDLQRFMFCSAFFHNGGYVTIRYEGKKHKLHRAVMGFPDCDVDHKNQIKTDCRKTNLRLATKSQNGANRGINCNNTSGYKGVTWDKRGQRWVAQIKYKYKNIRIGSYKTAEEAALAYNRKSKELHGEFASLNSIEELLS